MLVSVRAVSHDHVSQVHHKLDMLGIGAQHTKDPSGIAWSQNRDFENLLKRLNANSEDPTEDKADAAPIDGFQRARVDEAVADPATVGLETKGRDEERKRKKKRLRDDDETTKTERASKKRKKAESTTTLPPVKVGLSSSGSPTPETISFVVYCSYQK